MSNLLNVSSSPHARSKATTQNIMQDVLIALLPATVFGVIQFGLYSLAVIAVAVVVAVLTEYLFEKEPIEKSQSRMAVLHLPDFFSH